MKRRRVKITGIGPVTPAGIGREEFWKGILEPVSRIKPLERFDGGSGPFVAAQVEKFNINKFIDKNLIPKGAARHTLMAVAGACLALQDAGLSTRDLRGLKGAVVTGSSIMDFGGILNSVDSAGRKGPSYAQARVIFTGGIGSVPSAICSSLELDAQSVAISNHCTSGLDAVGYAFHLLESGAIDFAICGGTEAPLHRFPLLELQAAEMTPASIEMYSRMARPFDLWRTTGVVSEGCCMFLLEPESSSRSGYSYLSGYGFFSDDSEVGVCGGLYGSGKIALGNAGVNISNIDVINAWGPGHKSVDAGECAAMARLFGEGIDEIAALSIKGAIGTPLGAAGAIQLASASLSQRFGVLPPTVNWMHPDPACPLALSAQPRVLAHDYTLVNSHGLGAINSSIVIEKC